MSKQIMSYERIWRASTNMGTLNLKLEDDTVETVVIGSAEVFSVLTDILRNGDPVYLTDGTLDFAAGQRLVGE